jgi:hypothetical protein
MLYFLDAIYCSIHILLYRKKISYLEREGGAIFLYFQR